MKNFDAPIPGQSLTKPPGNYPWERPPEIVDPEQVTQMHLIRLTDEDKINTVLDALEFGVVDLYTLVKGIMRSAVANGVHTVEAGMIAAPVVHAYLKKIADAAGIEYDDGINEGTRKEQDQKMRASLKAQKVLKEMGMNNPEVPDREEPIEEEEEEKPRGLMARGE